jgi:hypothetical protein
MEKKRQKPAPNEQNRRQLVEALEKTAAAAMPTPNLDVGEIKISASKLQRDAVANQIIAAAAQCGGSAVKNLSDENGLLLFAEIPAAGEADFREKLADLGAPPSKPISSSSNTNRIIQIRIVGNENR